MNLDEAKEFLSDPENREVISVALERICRERPEWWIRFLERESRLRGGRYLERMRRD